MGKEVGDTTGLSSNIAIGGCAAMIAASVIADATSPHILPSYDKTVDEVAKVRALDDSLKNKPSSIGRTPEQYYEDMKEWEKNTEENTKKEADAIKKKRDEAAAPILKQRKIRADKGASIGVAATGIPLVLLAGASGGHARREEENKAAAKENKTERGA